MPRPAKKQTRKGGAPELPPLHTINSYAAHLHRTADWVRRAIHYGQIPAAQLVGKQWVIPEDALVFPRYMVGFPGKLLDLDLPDDVIGGTPVNTPKPKYSHGEKGRLGRGRKSEKSVRVPQLFYVRTELGYSREELARRSGISKSTIEKAECGVPIKGVTAKMIANGLGVEPERLLRHYDG